jgi:3-phosphoinositide dependent protein kinase-1
MESSDFRFGPTLGKGAFAKVVLGQLKSSGQEYAIKIVEKAHIKKHNKINLIMTEKKALVAVDHPLIVKYFKINNFTVMHTY